MGECQRNFNYLPIKAQLTIRTAKFLQSFTASENTLSVIQAQSIESAPSENFFLNMERHTVPARLPAAEMQYTNNLCSMINCCSRMHGYYCAVPQ